METTDSGEPKALVLGDGDLSFSAALNAEGLRLTATTLESREDLVRRYANAGAHIAALEGAGARVLHGVDATRLRETLPGDVGSLFHRIIFNFPYQAFGGIKGLRRLLAAFLEEAAALLAPDGVIEVALCAGQGGTAKDRQARQFGTVSWSDGPVHLMVKGTMDSADIAAQAALSHSRVAGVREFQIAKALMQGRDLSQLVPSQWGPVHLFDLCISFGYQDTANAMAEVSDAATARLLDIAILTGNKEAALSLAGAKLWPLRRWRSQDLFNMRANAPLVEPRILIAALSAGADLQLLVVSGWGLLPLREAVVLLTTWPWSDFAGLLGGKSPWVPEKPNRLVEAMLEVSSRGHCISHSLLKRAAMAGLPLTHFNLPGFGYHWNLLQAAVLCGQPDCAEMCAALGVESLDQDLCRFICQVARHPRQQARGWANSRRAPPLDLATETLDLATESERRSAAAAAARAAFIRSRRLEGREKGVALLQAMAKLSRGPALPVLVEKVIDFLVEVPVTSLADLPKLT
ncbi:unnamed protein product [Effrenium voratum]|uniref:25S rRNA (uridine-N(3))-methyltransferase BMT5-like domain-containing protein n=1 Tax=Effrenium voratum TaxID=2562239 RepID=A0AA36HMW5_9DINO|nr:unnamed protein product [Effrenium voratum]